MLKPTPSFPAAVWPGTSATRLDYINDYQEPTAEDHDRVVEEMQAVQTDLRTYTPVVFQITVPNASGDVDFTVPYKVKVIDVFAMKTAANGGSGDTVTVKNGSTAISNAMSLNINDQLLARATSINDASQVIEAGGTLRATGASSTNCACIVSVVCLKQD